MTEYEHEHEHEPTKPGFVIAEVYNYMTNDPDSIDDKPLNAFKIFYCNNVCKYINRISIDMFKHIVTPQHVIIIDTLSLTYEQCNYIADILSDITTVRYVDLLINGTDVSIATLLNRLPLSVWCMKIEFADDINNNYNTDTATTIANFLLTSRVRNFTLFGDAASIYAMEIIIDACARVDDLQSLTIATSYYLDSLCLLHERRSQKPFRLNVRGSYNELDNKTITCLQNFKQLHILDIRNCSYGFVESISNVTRANDNINTLISVCNQSILPIAINTNIKSIKCTREYLSIHLLNPQFHTIESDVSISVDHPMHDKIMNALEQNTTLLVSRSLSLMDSSAKDILQRNNMITKSNVTKALIDLALIFVNILPPYVLVEVFDWISPYYYKYVSLKFKVEIVLRLVLRFASV